MARIRRRITIITALAAGVSALGCGSNPTGPDSAHDVVSLEVACPATLLVGQTGFCLATARFRDGSSTGATAAWSSSDLNVATIGPTGNLTGRGAGKVVASASYLGLSGAASVSVDAEDVLRAETSAIQGTFRVGNTVTMWLQGFYGVASVDSGVLTLVIKDQNGTTVSTSSPRTVPKGGDSFLLSSTFVIPTGTTQVCRTAILQLDSLTLMATGGPELFPCVAVAQ
jgi:Flp pilus assembly protein TadG